MADQFDRAQELDAMAVEAARAEQERRAARSAKLAPVGHCLNPACEEPLEGQRLFCGPACEAEHRRRSGK
jgi:hypothetical protein